MAEKYKAAEGSEPKIRTPCKCSFLASGAWVYVQA